MLNFSWSKAAWVLLTLGLTTGTFAPLLTLDSTPASAASGDGTAFPDTQNHWAQPFIKVLAEKELVTGYLDGTYRPENPVAREEFAAIIRQAFDQPLEREIDNGGVFKDVPPEYWASPAIEEAYETGFMLGDPDGFFYPTSSISRAEVLAVLSKKLDLSNATATRPPAEEAIVQPAPEQPAPEANSTTQTRRQTNRRPLLFPLAMTALMQPLVRTPAQAQQAAVAPIQGAGSQPDPTGDVAAEPSPAAEVAPAVPTAIETVRNYYVDANEVPEYAIDGVAEATQAGVVVNYPDPKVLNPNQPATRGEVAAFVHQALVNQGRVEPIAGDTPVANYIVKGQ